MLSIYLVVAFAIAFVDVNSSPVNELENRNFPPAFCSAIEEIVDVLELNKATPFCSSFLHIPTKTATKIA